MTGWDEPLKDETTIEETQAETVISESTSFKGPYDPFDSMEKEACIKGLNFKDQMVQKPDTKPDIQFEYSDQDLNNETPPVAMDFVPTNADGFKIASTSNESNHQQKLQKQVVHLNAIRMSSISTPPNHPSTKFSRNAILTENLQMIAAESPIKLIEDEPNPIQYSPAPTSTSNLSDDTCSNTEFEARLKMLRIAMLETHVKTQEPHGQMPITPSPNQGSNVGEVGRLLQDLKSLICEHVDESKRNQFDIIIESISAAVHSNSSSPSATEDAKSLATDSPQTYKRQATFDLDLEMHKKKTAETPEYVIGTKVQEFPDAMTCSSATFDGESLASDKAAIPIPIIDTEPPNVSDDKSSPRPKPDSYVTEVVNDNLALQINELLERHNLTKLQMNDNEQHTYESEHNVGGPTVILVVNSTGGNQLPSCVVHPTTTRTSKLAATNANISSNRASTLRRRSSSLSIHDKSKQERPRSLVKQSSGDSSSTTTTSNQCMPLKELSVVGDKFNAMSSYRQRRNSFSVGLTAGKAGATASAIAQGRTLLSGRNKASPISESNIKSKDVIPIKRVAPMVKPLNMSTDVKYLNSTMPRCVGQETPMPARSKPASKLFCTSTPMPQMRSQQLRSLKPVNSYSNSCASTPNVRASMGYSKKAAQ